MGVDFSQITKAWLSEGEFCISNSSSLKLLRADTSLLKIIILIPSRFFAEIDLCVMLWLKRSVQSGFPGLALLRLWT